MTLLKKMRYRAKQKFSTEEYQMAKKHLKKKLFNILNYQGNANQIYPEILPYTSQNG
jgi:hypothetical protein